MNGYSERWRAHFGEPDPARTAAEVAFLREALPLPAFRRVLDVPCGSGRHARALGALGYEVVGVDGDPAVLPDVVCDLRELDSLPGGFDALINLWASFGYFDDDANAAVLASFARRVRSGGRVVLDVPNAGFFASRTDERRELGGGIVERSRVRGGRRLVELRYPGGAVERFDWRLYAPDELVALAEAAGLAPLVVAGGAEEPAMRLVLERAE